MQLILYTTYITTISSDFIVTIFNSLYKAHFSQGDSTKQKKKNLLGVSSQTLSDASDTFETTQRINNWLGHDCQSDILPAIPVTSFRRAHIPVQVQDHKQTPSHERKKNKINADCGWKFYFQREGKIKTGCLHLVRTDAVLNNNTPFRRQSGRRSFPVVHMCLTVIEDVTPHSALPSCLRVVWPDCHSGTPCRK